MIVILNHTIIWTLKKSKRKLNKCYYYLKQQEIPVPRAPHEPDQAGNDFERKKLRIGASVCFGLRKPGCVHGTTIRSHG